MHTVCSSSHVYPSMHRAGGVFPGRCLSRRVSAQGGCLPRRVSAQGWCLPRGVSAQGSVCPGGVYQGCLPRGVSAQGVSTRVSAGVCPGGVYPRQMSAKVGVCPWGGVCQGVVYAQRGVWPERCLPRGVCPGGIYWGCLPRGLSAQMGVSARMGGVFPKGNYAVKIILILRFCSFILFFRDGQWMGTSSYKLSTGIWLYKRRPKKASLTVFLIGLVAQLIIRQMTSLITLTTFPMIQVKYSLFDTKLICLNPLGMFNFSIKMRI